MIFLMYISAILALTLLLASTAVIVWSLRKEGAGVLFAKVVGFIIFIFSLFAFIGIVSFKFKYWNQGYFEIPIAMTIMNQKKDKSELRERMMQRLEQIKKMREQKKEMEKAPTSGSSPEEKKAQ